MSLVTGDNPKAGTLTATTTAGAVNANQPCVAVLIQNDPGSSNNLVVGDSGAQTIVLTAGQAITINCGNLNQVYIAGVGGNATVNWLAVR